MCLCVILAGNWVLLICVWGCRFCSSFAHMHIKLLYELDTCPRLRSPSISLARRLNLPVSVTKMVIRASPLPSPRPITPSWPSSDLVTDGTDKMRLSAFFKLWNLKGETHWWGYYTFHTAQRLLSIKCDCLSHHFSPDILSALFFSPLLSHHLIDHIYLVSPSPSLFNNNPLSSFILSVMVSSSIIALCCFPISDLSDGFLSTPTFSLSSCPLCAALLVSVSIGSSSSLCVCVWRGYSMSLPVWC